MTVQIILGDKNPDLIAAWDSAFAGVQDVRTRGGNILMATADALVSPANSFGFMDGGLDWSISDLFEWKIQAIVQKVIRTKHAGELLVGDAEIVATNHEKFRYLVCAPTMRIPQNVESSINAFLAMRAILLSVQRFNAANNGAKKSVVIPGLCTGVGKMPYERCARQMRTAYDLVNGKTSNHYSDLKTAIDDELKYKA